MKKELEDILRKVQALLTRADHPNTPVPEAESCRAKAEALMFKYRIEETQLDSSGHVQGIKPEWRTIDVCSNDSEYTSFYRMMASSVAQHVGIRGVFHVIQREDGFKENGDAEYTMHVVMEAAGYDSDLGYAELLYTACRVAFQSKLEPKVDPSKSDEENAYIMRSAGMEGWRIAEAIYGSKEKTYCIRARKLFKKYAESIGEDPTVLLGRGNTMKDFRKQYAEGFENELYYRLANMRSSRAQSEVGLVLKGRVDAINELFYDRYPQFRPVDDGGYSKTYADPREGCAKCAKAKSGYCRDHSYLKPSTARPKQRRTNWAARERGADAARTVDLGPGGTAKVEPTNTKGELR